MAKTGGLWVEFEWCKWFDKHNKHLAPVKAYIVWGSHEVQWNIPKADNWLLLW